MLKFYQVRLPSDPEVIGVSNGIKQVELVSLKKGVSIGQLADRFASASTVLGSSPLPDDIAMAAKPLRGAILTDFLSYGPYMADCPFLSSDRARATLDKFKVADHAWFNAEIARTGGGRLDYALFRCPALEWDVIDFPGSSFYTGTAIIGKRFLSFQGVDDYFSYQEANPRAIIRAETLALSAAFDDGLDFFELKFGGGFASERLVQACQAEGLTGVKFLPAYGLNDDRTIYLK